MSRISLVSVILDSGWISVISEKKDVLNVCGFAVKLSSPTFVGLQPEERQSAVSFSIRSVSVIHDRLGLFSSVCFIVNPQPSMIPKPKDL